MFFVDSILYRKGVKRCHGDGTFSWASGSLPFRGGCLYVADV
jgi:hypothetical protein